MFIMCKFDYGFNQYSIECESDNESDNESESLDQNIFFPNQVKVA